MNFYQLPDYDPPSGSFWKRNAWWLIPLLILDVLAVAWLFWPTNDAPAGGAPPVIAPAMVAEPAPPPRRAGPPGLTFGFPTVQQDLLLTNKEGVYMPTASGRHESAFYGSTRTASQGNRILPSFHEGIDIAPLTRDRRQMPLDRIFAVAGGRVAHVSAVAGNSNYGRYIVLVHDDPFGEIYTLYAHLEAVTPGLAAGQRVTIGQDIGVMGRSPSHIIPVARSHLHYEVGVILNQNFHTWYRRQKRVPDHGNFHGHNLRGIDPLDVYRQQEAFGEFRMGGYLLDLPPAFSIVFRAARVPDYYQRYRGLWGPGAFNGVIYMDVSEGGVPLRARPATDEEMVLPANRSHRVVMVDEDVLGRNGQRLVVRRQGAWQVGSNGESWLEILLFYP